MTTAVVTTQPDFFGLADVLPPGLQFEPALDLMPRSAYLMRGPASRAWQHSVPPVPGLCATR